MQARLARWTPAGLVIAGALLGGCAPRGLDAQQQRVEARECASLLERHITGRQPPRSIVIDGTSIDLGTDPGGFYRQLEAARGPDAFALVGEKPASAQRASFVSDLCKAKDASSSSSSPSASTTTTTITTTAPPHPATNTGG
ncbi:MAG: hypothetical protein ACR2LQ_14475 [Acidimicrobiales bacterium]